MKKLLLETAERAIKTLVQTFAAAWATSGATDLDTLGQLGLAAIVAALSVVTSALSAGVGTKGTASLLPAGE